jgi:hypothetical protein
MNIPFVSTRLFMKAGIVVYFVYHFISSTLYSTWNRLGAQYLLYREHCGALQVLGKFFWMEKEN